MKNLLVGIVLSVMLMACSSMEEVQNRAKQNSAWTQEVSESFQSTIAFEDANTTPGLKAHVYEYSQFESEPLGEFELSDASAIVDESETRAGGDTLLEGLQARMEELDAIEPGTMENARSLLKEALQSKFETTESGYVAPVAFFELGQSELSSEAQEQADKIASILKEFPNATVTLRGLTDGSGSATLNEQLALQRASQVASRVMAQGIDQDRILVVAVGVATGVEDKVSANARRVEAVFAE